VENLLSKEDLVSMDRGCVCCSLRNDIVKALKDLQGRAGGRGVAHDAILLETTGLADPAPVAFTFFANSWISANYRLDSILCLVDAQHLREVRGSPALRGAACAACRGAQAQRTPPPLLLHLLLRRRRLLQPLAGWLAGWLAGCSQARAKCAPA
jgi:G3E family GTPase